MNENWELIESTIESFPRYKSAIFEKGFLLTNAKISILNEFPFYDNWRRVALDCAFCLFVHKAQKAFVYNKNGVTYFLIGHAYNPFRYICDEIEILSDIAKQSFGSFEKAIDYINELTGLFVFGIIKNNNIKFCGDFESMYSTYYGKIGKNIYLSSHEELIASFEKLCRNAYVERLEKYRWYYLYGEGLPGDISHYNELKKLMCNTYVDFSGGAFSVRRFYPVKPLNMCKDESDYRENVKRIAWVMKRSIELIAKKWDVAAVSVTGGRDSKGSLAAAAHLADRIKYFSYNSQKAEQIDCDAAKKICDYVGVQHTTYNIPLDKSVYPEYDLVNAILCVNSNRKRFNHNDIMKRIFFRNNHDFDVEIKSWTSEIGRAFYYQRYGVKKLQKKCTARRVNVMNNIYLFNPVLMYQTDSIYRDYLKKTQYNEHMFNYDWSDIIDLEMRDSRWGADVLTCEHMFAYYVTVPYNNRNLGDLFLSVPFEKRLSDQTHIDFTNLLCLQIENANISVKDYAHNNKRILMDRYYYFISSIRLL